MYEEISVEVCTGRAARQAVADGASHDANTIASPPAGQDNVMGIHDRPYWQEGQPGGYGGGGQQRGGGLMVGMPRAGRAVKILLLINVVVFVLQMIVDQQRAGYPYGVMSGWLGATPGAFWQIWRYVTFQFLHSTGGIWHIAMNMLGLYMLGSPLERQWGSRRFVKFYLICGAVGGLAYVIIGNVVGKDLGTPIVGASGGVFGIILACAVLFPNFRLIFFLFPVPIRVAALIIFGGMALVILNSVGKGQYSDPQFWSDVAHLGGAAAAAVWIWGLPKLSRASAEARVKRQQGAWRRRLERQAAQQAEIDRILEKVHRRGINSLTAKEKQTLRDATRRQREEGL